MTTCALPLWRILPPASALLACLFGFLPLLSSQRAFASQDSVPVLLQPSDGTLLRSNMPTFVWSAPGARSCQLWLDGRLHQTLPGDAGTFIPFPLSFGKHHWRIVAENEHGQRESGTASFSIEDTPLSATPADSVLLREDWSVASSLEVGMDGAALSSGRLPSARWSRSSVPATALAALVRNGIYENPYLHTNSLRIPDSSDAFNQKNDRLRFSHIPGKNPWSKPYWFVRDFVLPPGHRTGRLWLNLGEINHRAELWLNGHRLAGPTDLAGMERSFRIAIDEAVRREGPNHLAIALYPVESPGEPAPPPSKPLDDPGQNMGQDGMVCMNYTRWDTQGWDWQTSVPDRDMGITEDVFISRTDDLAIGELCIAPQLRLGAQPSAELLLDLELENFGSTAAEAKLSLHLSDGRDQQRRFALPVKLSPAGITRLHLDPRAFADLHLENPRLWWPHEMGEPALHRLEIELSDDKGVLSRKSLHFGIRKVETSLDRDGHRLFHINGRRLFMKGGNWVNDMLLTWTASRYEQEIALARHAGLNFLRVWGPNGVPPQAFFDAADRQGVLIWQDFLHDHWGTFQTKQGYAPELDLFLKASTAVVRKLRNHPSLFLWCGGNEGRNPREDWLVDRVLPENDAEGQRPYLLSSNGDGLQGGGPYHNLPPSEYFSNPKLRGFNSEVGPSGVPEWESLAKFLTLPSTAWAPGRFPLSAEWAFHNATDQASPTDPRKFSTYDSLLRRCYGMPEGTDVTAMQAYSQRCQLINYDVYRAALESLNQGMWRGTTGFALWKFNASWPGLTWQISDWYLQANAGYYAVRKACAPLHLQFDRDTRRLRLINREAMEAEGLRLEARLLDARGATLWSEQRSMTAPADQSTDTGLVVPAAKALSFLSLTLRDTNNHLLSDNLYWLSPKDDFKALVKMPAPKLETRLTRNPDRESLELVITNTGATPALLIRAMLVSLDTGLECLPSLWSDNYLHLAPGEQRQLTVRTSGLGLPGKAGIRLQAWNLSPIILQAPESK